MSNIVFKEKKDIEQDRIYYAIEQIEKQGYDIEEINDKNITFYFKGSIVVFWPYTGWATGKTIKDVRGIQNLINQIKTK